jgi:hypothetical protein
MVVEERLSCCNLVYFRQCDHPICTLLSHQEFAVERDVAVSKEIFRGGGVVQEHQPCRSGQTCFLGQLKSKTLIADAVIIVIYDGTVDVTFDNTLGITAAV